MDNPFSPMPYTIGFGSSLETYQFLLEGLIEDGWIYFVTYNEIKTFDDYEKSWCDAISWLKSQGIRHNWIGGRFKYELCFKTLEDATIFKLAYGI
jgi:hypothetical protein